MYTNIIKEYTMEYKVDLDSTVRNYINRNKVFKYFYKYIIEAISKYILIIII